MSRNTDQKGNRTENEGKKKDREKEKEEEKKGQKREKEEPEREAGSPCWCGSGLPYASCHREAERKLELFRARGEHVPDRRLIRNREQLAGIREAGRVNALVLDAVAEMVHEGISTQQIDDTVRRVTGELGGRPACLGFEGYPKSVCTSVNDVICHGIPRADQILHAGDILNVDCTTEYGGYIGDASRMFCIGTPSPEAAALVRVTEEAVERALSVLHPYCHLGDIGAEIASYVGRHGYTVVHEIGGHGVGLSMHEEPYVAHYGRAGHGMLLFPGMVFTIEPMVNAGSRRFVVDPVDGWTVRTADHSLSAQVEYMIEMTEEGPVVLSR